MDVGSSRQPPEPWPHSLLLESGICVESLCLPHKGEGSGTPEESYCSWLLDKKQC